MMYSPPVRHGAHYAHINLQICDKKFLVDLVGQSGNFLEKMTNKYCASYLWMDFQNKRLEIWASEHEHRHGIKKKLWKEIKKVMAEKWYYEPSN